MGVGPGPPLEDLWSPGDLKLLGVMTRLARVPGCLGVDELELPARLGGSEEVHPERAWPWPGACARVTEVLAGVCSRPGWVGRALSAGSVRVGSRGVVNHGPHVTASGCRHDDWQRGSERFFHPSPTKKRPDVEQARWARGPRRAAAGYDQAPCHRPGFGE